MHPFDDEHVPAGAVIETKLGVEVMVAALGAAEGVSVPVIVEPSSARHRVVMVVPFIVNVMSRRNGVLSPGFVNVTVAIFALTVPATLDRPSPHPAHVMTVSPDTELPLWVSVTVIGTPAPVPNVPDHVPVNAVDEEGVVGEEEPLPHPSAATIRTTLGSATK